MIEIFGARVRQARVIRGRTATSVAERLGWSNARQSKVEQVSSVMMFTDDEVRRLSSELRFPAKFFSAEPRSRVTREDLLFRAPKAMTKGEQEFLATFAALAGDFLDDLDGRRRLPPVIVPSTDLAAERLPLSVAAQRVRRAMGLEVDEPIDDLMYEVERIGAPIIVRRRAAGDWSSEFSATTTTSRGERHLGYSSWVGAMRRRPLVVIRESASWERTRFTVAHELGHLVLHSNSITSLRAVQEEEANRFATEFLAPAAVIAGELPAAMSLLNLKPLKDKWGLSLGSLIRHLRDSSLIDDTRAKMLTTQMHTRRNPATGHTWGMTEPGWDEREVEQPRMIGKWVECCHGSTSVPALAAMESNILPTDVLEWFLATQRAAPVSEFSSGRIGAMVAPAVRRNAQTATASEVTSLDQWRGRRG